MDTASTSTIDRAADSLLSERIKTARRGKYLREITAKLLAYALLMVVAVVFLLPIIYMMSTSLKQSGTEFIYPPQFFNAPLWWQNYRRVFELVPFARFTFNSFLISSVGTFGAVLSASMAGYAFARLPFRGRSLLFWLTMITMMVPIQVLLIPQFVFFTKVHWIGTYLPMIIPPFFGGGAWAILMFRQFFMTLPQELIDAAEIDGASPWRIFWVVILPLSKPVVATATVLFFMTFWNDFLAPLVFLRAQELQTIPVAMAGFSFAVVGLPGAWAVLMAATTISILPMMIIFVFSQKYFVQGIARTGLKG